LVEGLIRRENRGLPQCLWDGDSVDPETWESWWLECAGGMRTRRVVEIGGVGGVGGVGAELWATSSCSISQSTAATSLHPIQRGREDVRTRGREDVRT
jgi:hypothetical protein